MDCLLGSKATENTTFKMWIHIFCYIFCSPFQRYWIDLELVGKTTVRYQNSENKKAAKKEKSDPLVDIYNLQKKMQKDPLPSKSWYLNRW